jgi:Bor protein
LKHWIVMAMLVTILLIMGCSAHTHIVGDGGQETQVNARQWYILWGLVPLNKVETKDMAEGAENYTVYTRMNFLDFLINIPTSLITVNSRTVSVTK